MLLDADSAQGEGKSKRKRCTFWPQCANGAQCPFYHPTENCKYVPVASPSSADEAHVRHRACSTLVSGPFMILTVPFALQEFPQLFVRQEVPLHSPFSPVQVRSRLHATQLQLQPSSSHVCCCRDGRLRYVVPGACVTQFPMFRYFAYDLL
jgi:hypothetical protein